MKSLTVFCLAEVSRKSFDDVQVLFDWYIISFHASLSALSWQMVIRCSTLSIFIVRWAVQNKFYVEEKLIIDYLSHLQDIDDRKEIREQERQELKCCCPVKGGGGQA